MIVKTAYPIYVDGEVVANEDWLDFDQNSSSDVKAFQDWMDVNHPNWVKEVANLNKGKGYGTYGPSTKKAWGKYGSDYTKSLGVVSPTETPKPSTTSETSPKDATPQPESKPAQTAPEAKKDDKKSSMKKMLLYGGIGLAGLIVVVLVIRKLTK